MSTTGSGGNGAKTTLIKALAPKISSSVVNAILLALLGVGILVATVKWALPAVAAVVRTDVPPEILQEIREVRALTDALVQIQCLTADEVHLRLSGLKRHCA